ncbi:MAG: hypothetical protein PHQ02_07650 [Candidatus Riflebacteria bacterium]|nr:hypothetical protein [Candidatus Riflebacteria bacterium]
MLRWKQIKKLRGNNRENPEATIAIILGQINTKSVCKKQFISSEQKQHLKAALDTGHAVIHRGFQPTDDIVNKVIDIIESLLINYSLNKNADELNEITPKRNNKK